jgi:hypothetical protein
MWTDFAVSFTVCVAFGVFMLSLLFRGLRNCEAPGWL